MTNNANVLVTSNHCCNYARKGGMCVIHQAWIVIALRRYIRFSVKIPHSKPLFIFVLAKIIYSSI